MKRSGDALHMTALLAPEPGIPIEIFDGNAALHMVIVDRQSVTALDETWDAPGIYLLLDPVALDGAYGAYVGKAPAGLRARLRQHRTGKAHWSRAVLVIRDTTHGWHSAQVGWLEGRLYDLLDGATLASLSNGNRPQDETLPPYERAPLEAAVEPVAAVLRLLGCSPDTFDEEAPRQSAPAETPRHHYGVDVATLVSAGDLTAGEKLTSTQTSAPATALIQGDGSLLIDGERFSSPSAAGSHVRTGKATNGWAFWGVERDGSTVPLATIRARYLRRQEPTSPPPTTARAGESGPDASGGGPQEVQGPARRNASPEVVEGKRARRSEEHVVPMDELSGRIAEAVGHPVPHADPDYGGTRARALLLLCDPAPKTDHDEGSGYISPDNDDATAERVHDLLAANRIAPEDVVTWNVVPWLRPGAAGQSLAVDDRDEGNRWLGELLELLPRLRVVAVLGRDAQKSLLRTTAPPLTPYARIDAPHPGRRSQNNAELRSALDAAFVDVVRGVAGELPPATVLDHWPDGEP